MSVGFRVCQSSARDANAVAVSIDACFGVFVTGLRGSFQCIHCVAGLLITRIIACRLKAHHFTHGIRVFRQHFKLIHVEIEFRHVENQRVQGKREPARLVHCCNGNIVTVIFHVQQVADFVRSEHGIKRVPFRQRHNIRSPNLFAQQNRRLCIMFF